MASSAIMAEPLSVRSARGRPRFWIAWESPCTRSSAVSERYHWTWQQSREWSSRMPSAIGRTHWPSEVSTLSDEWWKSRCHKDPANGASKLRISRVWRRSSAALRRGFDRAQASACAASREPACSVLRWNNSAAARARVRPGPGRPDCRSEVGNSSAGARDTGDGAALPVPAARDTFPQSLRTARRNARRGSSASRRACSTSVRWWTRQTGHCIRSRDDATSSLRERGWPF